ncbi:MAG: hypothetical protein WCJ70_04915 [bacterium]
MIIVSFTPPLCIVQEYNNLSMGDHELLIKQKNPETGTKGGKQTPLEATAQKVLKKEAPIKPKVKTESKKAAKDSDEKKFDLVSNILDKDQLTPEDQANLYEQHKALESVQHIMDEQTLFAQIIVFSLETALDGIPTEQTNDEHGQNILSQRRLQYVSLLAQWMVSNLSQSQAKVMQSLTTPNSQKNFITKTNVQRAVLLGHMLGALGQPKGSSGRKAMRDGALAGFFNYTFAPVDDTIPKDETDKARRRFTAFSDLYLLMMSGEPNRASLKAYFDKHTGPLKEVQEEADAAAKKEPEESGTLTSPSGSKEDPKGPEIKSAVKPTSSDDATPARDSVNPHASATEDENRGPGSDGNK